MAIGSLNIHHMTHPTGEYVGFDCPHCARPIVLVAKVLRDYDTVTLDYAEEHQSGRSPLEEGDTVRVVRIDTKHAMTREFISCFLGKVGRLTSEPNYEGFADELMARGECWVEFPEPCPRHGDTDGIFLVSELEKVEED